MAKYKGRELLEEYMHKVNQAKDLETVDALMVKIENIIKRCGDISKLRLDDTGRRIFAIYEEGKSRRWFDFWITDTEKEIGSLFQKATDYCDNKYKQLDNSLRDVVWEEFIFDPEAAALIQKAEKADNLDEVRQYLKQYCQKLNMIIAQINMLTNQAV